MKKLIFLFLTFCSFQISVLAFCDAHMDPMSYQNCINKENYNRQMMLMQKQQLEMQQKMLNTQIQAQEQVQWQKQNEQSSFFSGVLDVDYYKYMLNFAKGEVPYMSREEFARVYNYNN